MPKTRKERRKARKEVYLDGRASNPHCHSEASSSSVGASICSQCAPVLLRYSSDLAKAWYHGAAPHYAAWAGFPVVLAYIVLPRII